MPSYVCERPTLKYSFATPVRAGNQLDLLEAVLATGESQQSHPQQDNQYSECFHTLAEPFFRLQARQSSQSSSTAGQSHLEAMPTQGGAVARTASSILELVATLSSRYGGLVKRVAQPSPILFSVWHNLAADWRSRGHDRSAMCTVALLHGGIYTKATTM